MDCVHAMRPNNDEHNDNDKILKTLTTTNDLIKCHSKLTSTPRALYTAMTVRRDGCEDWQTGCGGEVSCQGRAAASETAQPPMVESRDDHGNGIPSGNGNPMGIPRE